MVWWPQIKWYCYNTNYAPPFILFYPFFFYCSTPNTNTNTWAFIYIYIVFFPPSKQAFSFCTESLWYLLLKSSFVNFSSPYCCIFVCSRYLSRCNLHLQFYLSLCTTRIRKGHIIVCLDQFSILQMLLILSVGEYLILCCWFAIYSKFYMFDIMALTTVAWKKWMVSL